MDEFVNAIRNLDQIKSFELEDVSHLHSGHNGFSGKVGSHFILKITPAKGIDKIEIQKIITKLSFPCYQNGVHSISVKIL